jgi:hypothetical protein
VWGRALRRTCDRSGVKACRQEVCNQEIALEELGSIPGRVALRELKRVADDPAEYIRLRRVAKEVIARRGNHGIDSATVVDE